MFPVTEITSAKTIEDLGNDLLRVPIPVELFHITKLSSLILRVDISCSMSS